MSIVSLPNVKIYLNIDEEDDSEDDLLTLIHNGVEDYVAKHLARTLESTSYTEIYDGPGTTDLILNQYPVTAVTKVSISFSDVIKIKNTSTGASNAYVTVDSDSLDLEVVGGANEDSTSLAFSSYATMSAMVTAINALGKGWDAVMVNPDYNDLKTTGLLEEYNVSCGGEAGETAGYEYLYWGEPLEGFDLYPDKGILYYPGGFPRGRRNVYVTYTGGFAAASMPASTQLDIMGTVKAIYTRHGEDGKGVASFSSGGLTVKYLDELVELQKRIEGYKDWSKVI